MPSLRLLPADRVVQVAHGTRLIDAIRGAGMPIARACGDDLICGLCGVRVLDGAVPREKPVETRAKRRNRIRPELRLACALRVRGDLTLTADYWGDVSGDGGLRSCRARC